MITRKRKQAETELFTNFAAETETETEIRSTATIQCTCMPNSTNEIVESSMLVQMMFFQAQELDKKKEEHAHQQAMAVSLVHLALLTISLRIVINVKKLPFYNSV